ncbi:MAG: hypothetical protein IPM74_10605 [Crocinitomicaceae bacterium]|nr:hypothetical protein [Crocinitomicaceae bacterium]MBK8926338.1 hypothetical protein [Crocinitomicaceae bacterium]
MKLFNNILLCTSLFAVACGSSSPETMEVDPTTEFKNLHDHFENNYRSALDSYNANLNYCEDTTSKVGYQVFYEDEPEFVSHDSLHLILSDIGQHKTNTVIHVSQIFDTTAYDEFRKALAFVDALFSIRLAMASDVVYYTSAQQKDMEEFEELHNQNLTNEYDLDRYKLVSDKIKKMIASEYVIYIKTLYNFYPRSEGIMYEPGEIVAMVYVFNTSNNQIENQFMFDAANSDEVSYSTDVSGEDNGSMLTELKSDLMRNFKTELASELSLRYKVTGSLPDFVFN